ncbi:hypothetical protein PMAYCL1PPCAC_29540, partial [Pristionchus mayeri]
FQMVLYFFTIFLLICYIVRRFLLERLSIGAAGRWVLISGCDSGFGRLTALRLIEEGVNVFAGCYTQQGREALEKCAEEIDSSFRLHSFPLDITSDSSVADAFQFISKTLEANTAQLWGIVNNAGVFSIFGPDDWCSIKQYSDSLNVNCLGAVRMCHTFLPLLKQSKGRIVTMASSAGRMHGQFLAPYCTSKFAVEAYMDCLRFELRRFGVSVHILEPGAFKTELLSEEAQNARVDYIWNSLSEETKNEYGETYKKNCEYPPSYSLSILTSVKEAWSIGVNLMASSNLHWVTDHYTHALFSFWPRLRYYTGWDSRLLFIPLSLLPTFFQDCILSLMYRLQPGPSLVPHSLQSTQTLIPK